MIKIFNSRKKKVVGWKSDIILRIFSKAQNDTIMGTNYLIMPVSDTLFKVHNKEITHIVDLATKSCDYRA